MVFISGCLSWDQNGDPVATGNFTEQVRNVYGELQSILQELHLTFSDVLKETVFCRSMDGMVAAAGVRAEFLAGHSPIASTWVEINRLVNPELLVEIEMIAAREET
jgi:2-iminobutanoate/2-iminopropanoate deaminase